MTPVHFIPVHAVPWVSKSPDANVNHQRYQYEPALGLQVSAGTVSCRTLVALKYKSPPNLPNS